MASPPRTNIPAPGAAFVGRAADLRALGALLARGERLVTLVGSPGIGKTALATEFARAEQGAFCASDAGGGAWLCDLSEAHDADALCAAVAAVLDVPLAGGSTGAAVAQLGRAVAARGPTLLVLDNFEQLVAHADLVARWRDAAPAARFVVTSREALRVPGEVVYELAPLAVPAAGESDATAVDAEAVQLLLERTRRARRDFALAPGDAAAVGEIVRQLDGLPLALELAAARMTVLGPAELLARLAHRFETLSRGARASTRRHASLRGALDWSWDLLTDAERAALAQCAVFRGGFTVAAAEAVLVLPADAACDAEAAAPRVLDALQSLRDKSLLHLVDDADAGRAAATAAPRFALYINVREYAAERLAQTPGALDAAADRHAEHFAREALPWIAEPDVCARRAFLPALVRDRDNFIAAARRVCTAPGAPTAARATASLRALCALDRLVAAGGAMPAHHALLEEVTARAAGAGVAPRLWAEALAARARTRRRVGRAADADADLRAVEAIAAREGDRGLEARALVARAMLLASSGTLADARAAAERAAAIAAEAGDAHAESMAAWALGAALKEQGEPAAARAQFERSLRQYERAGHGDCANNAHMSLGVVCAEQGLLAAARAHLERSLAGYDAEGVRWGVALARGSLGIVEHLDGRLDAAAACYRDAIAALQRLGDLRFEGVYEGYLAMIEQARGQPDAALARFTRAHVLLEQAGDPRYRALMLGQAATVFARQGRAAAARDALAEASALLPREGDVFREALALQRAAVDAFGRDDATAGPAAAAPASPSPTATRALAVSADLRIVQRVLAGYAVGAATTTTPDVLALASGPPLRVHAEGYWLEPPGGARVDLDRSQTLRQLLLELMARRRTTPGRATSADALIAAVWRGERILPDAARNRLKVLVSRLRRSGLGKILQSRRGGYLLDPRVPLVVAQDDDDDPPAAM